MTRWRGLVVAGALGAMIGACGSPNPSLSIVIDLPPESSPAYPFAEGLLDSLRVTVATDGDPADLVATSAPLGEELDLSDVPFGRDLVLHVYGELDTAQVAYGRSCPFDVEDADTTTNDIHVYFSRLVRWGAGDSPAQANRRGGHILERDGGGLVIAGGDVAAPLELFNPMTGELSVLEEAPDTLAREGGALATLGAGRAIIVGGTSGGEPVSTIEVLPDLRDSVENGPSVRQHALAALVGDDALLAGGQRFEIDQFVLTNEAFEFRIGDGGALESPRRVGDLGSARRRHTLTRLSDEIGAAVLVAGGLDAADMPVTSAEVYRPLSRVFEPVVGTLTRWGHQAIRVPGGAILIIGGFEPDILDGSESPAQTMALFDPIAGSFTPAGDLPPRAGIVDFTSTPLPDGRILLVGGRSADGDIVDTAFIARFDPLNGQVDISETDSLTAPRAGHVATLACDGTVLVVGGESPIASPPIERYNPPPEARR